MIGLDMLTSLGQPTIRLRRSRWDSSKEGGLERKNKVEKIQLTYLETLGASQSNINFKIHEILHLLLKCIYFHYDIFPKIVNNINLPVPITELLVKNYEVIQVIHV